MALKKLLVFHPAIAPYRIDFFNVLNARFNAVFCFYQKHVSTQRFNLDQLVSLLTFKPQYLRFGIPLAYRDRVIKVGILSKIIKERPEIILCSEYSVTTLLCIIYAKLFFHKTKVYTLSDDSVEIASTCKGMRKIARALVLKRIHGLILCNAPAQQWYNRQFKELNTHCFPIIQDEVRLKTSHAIHNEKLINLKKKYNLKDRYLFLYVGRLASEKNLIFLLEAFSKQLKDKVDSPILIFVGDGPQKKELINHTHHLGIDDNVIFAGRFEGQDLYAWYQLANSFVLPSTYEPFGAVVNEALIFDLPVICSQKAGAAFLINDSNGQTFDPSKKEDLVELLKLKPQLQNKNIPLMPFTFQDEMAKLITFLMQ